MNTVLILRTQKWDVWRAKLEGLLLAAERRHWTIQDIDASRSKVDIPKLLSFWKPLGCVIVEGNTLPPQFHPALFKKVPVVYLDQGTIPTSSRVTAIKHDARAIVSAAVREFLSIGCKCIAYVGWPTQQHWSEDKRLAMRNILQPSHCRLEEFAPTGNSESDYTIQLKKFIGSLPAGTGILCVNDVIAARVIAAAKTLNRFIPDDLAVIGVDNDPLCQSISPQISSFALDFAAIGEAAMQAIESPQKRKRGTTYIPPLHFIRRRSTMRRLANDAEITSALELIRNNACQGLTAKEVIDVFSCSRRMAEIKFRKVVGHSILAEILQVRMEKVCELLKLKELPLQTLADMCGFPSGTLLYRQFKTAFGCTPRQWHHALYKCGRTLQGHKNRPCPKTRLKQSRLRKRKETSPSYNSQKNRLAMSVAQFCAER